MGINSVNYQSYYNTMPENTGKKSRAANSPYAENLSFKSSQNNPLQDTLEKSKPPKDGIDDGSIGFWGALKNIGKGAIKFFTGMFTDEKGDFSLKQTLKTIGSIALITAATFIPVIGPFVIPAICAYGAFDGVKNIISGISEASKATTDIEAEEAWQQVGSGATEGALSVAGYKASGGIKGAISKSKADFISLRNKYCKPKIETVQAQTNTASTEILPKTEITSTEDALVPKEPMTMTDEARAIYNRTKNQLNDSKPKINSDMVDDNLPISRVTKAELEEMAKDYEIFERDSRFIGKDPTKLNEAELKILQEFNKFFDEYLKIYEDYRTKLEKNSKAKGKNKMTEAQLEALKNQLEIDRNAIAKKWLKYCKENNLDIEAFNGWNQKGAQAIKHYFIKFIEDPKRLENIDIFIAALKEENLRFNLGDMETFSQSSKNLFKFITETATEEIKEHPGLKTGTLKTGKGKVYQVTQPDSKGIQTTYSWIGDETIKDNLVIYGKDPKNITCPESDLGVLIISTGDDISTVMTSSFDQFMNRITYKDKTKPSK